MEPSNAFSPDSCDALILLPQSLDTLTSEQVAVDEKQISAQTLSDAATVGEAESTRRGRRAAGQGLFRGHAAALDIDGEFHPQAGAQGRAGDATDVVRAGDDVAALGHELLDVLDAILDRGLGVLLGRNVHDAQQSVAVDDHGVEHAQPVVNTGESLAVVLQLRGQGTQSAEGRDQERPGLLVQLHQILRRRLVDNHVRQPVYPRLEQYLGHVHAQRVTDGRQPVLVRAVHDRLLQLQTCYRHRVGFKFQ